jgi:hypothetical protein
VLVAPAQGDALVARLTAELTSLRFEVVPVERSMPLSAAELEANARQHAARAAVQVFPADSRLELRFVAIGRESFVQQSLARDPEPAVTALRALEVLRRSLLESRAPDSGRRAPAAASRSEHKPSAPPVRVFVRQRTLGLGAGIAIAHGSGDIPASLHVLGALRRRFGSSFEAHALGLVPVGAGAVTARGGMAEFQWFMLGLGVSSMPVSTAPVTPALGFGIAGLMFRTRGVADPGFVGREAVDYAAFPHARGDVAWSVQKWLTLRLELLAGPALPRPLLLFGERRVAAWGQPALLGGLSLELRP